MVEIEMSDVEDAINCIRTVIVDSDERGQNEQANYFRTVVGRMLLAVKHEEKKNANS